MRENEIAEHLESTFQSLAIWSPIAATFAGITTIVVLAIGGLWARSNA